MGIFRWLFISIVSLAILVACQQRKRFKAELSQTLGLKEGAEVLLAGVEIGKVEKIRIKGGSALVEFSVESKHEVGLHADACAIPVPIPGLSFSLIKV